jgi:hypothetical protein
VLDASQLPSLVEPLEVNDQPLRAYRTNTFRLPIEQRLGGMSIIPRLPTMCMVFLCDEMSESMCLRLFVLDLVSSTTTLQSTRWTLVLFLNFGFLGHISLNPRKRLRSINGVSEIP